jgi:hypothetical protein
MSKLRIRLINPGPASFAGHRITVGFRQKVSGGETTDELTVALEATATASADGSAEVELPDKDTLVGELSLRVAAPDGAELRRISASLDRVDADSPLTIEVGPREPLITQPVEDPAFGAPQRLRGMLVDLTGKGRVASQQIVLFGRAAGAPADAPVETLLIATTDEAGYFYGPYPLGRFAEAFGRVGVHPTSIPIRLNASGELPERVFLAIELDSTGASAEGAGDRDACACDLPVPRDPDDKALVESPATFSTDVGAGGCVDFTKPNRVLEEFDYFAIVRTTEPDIRGLTIKEPPKISIGQIIDILRPQLFANALASRQPALSAGTQPAAGLLGEVSARSAASSAGLAVELPEAEMPELTNLAEMISIAALRALRAAEGGGRRTRPGRASGNGNGEDEAVSQVRIGAEIAKTLTYDPDGFSLTRLASAELATRKLDLVRVLDLLKRAEVPGRGGLTCDNPVDWDDEPTFYQACSIAHGHILHFKQQWVADGYSLGDLLYSLPLAPCQKKQIAVVDWERRESAFRSESLEERERLTAELSRDRDISEIAEASLNEEIRGGSRARTGAFGGGLGIGAILGPVGGLLGIGGGTSSASSSAWQTATRETTASSLQQLRERIQQAASAVRSQRSTVVQTVRQGETVTATTETVANHNHCHAMTIQYFEVLRHFLVRQKLAEVQECLLVPLLMSRFDSAKTRRWREPLSRFLREPGLRRGFDALERIANNYVGSDLPVGSYADGEIEFLEGFLRLTFRLARPRDDSEGNFNEAAWNVLAWLGLDPREFFETYLRNQRERDRIFAETLGPRIAEEIVNGLRLFAVDENDNQTELPIDPTLITSFRNEVSLYVSLRIDSPMPPLTRRSVRFLRIDTSIETPAGPRSISEVLPLGSKIIVDSGEIRYRTAHLAHPLFRSSHIKDDLTGTDPVVLYTPLAKEELRNPREEDKEAANRLLKHLNDHLEHYHRAIWTAMDPQRRFMLLDGFVAPNSQGRSVASVVENRLIGIIGNSLVMPVARGFHLDPTFNQDEEDPIDLFEHYQPATPVDPLRLAVPTKGVYAESVMGKCNSCERIDDSRFWRWEESPCPGEPTPIQPVSTESRRAEPPDLTPREFPAPIVAFQNAPSAPAPQGFAGLLELLSRPDLFRDLTGLTENQRNALEALRGALNTAQFFGGKAADLALQANMRRDVDRAMNKIREAKAEGLITEEQARSLTQSALRSMVGGGTDSPNESALTNEPEVEQAIRSAASTPGGDLSLSRSTAGGTETVRLRTPGAEDSLRSFIVTGPGTSAERRAFGPTALDKTARTRLSVRVRNMPAGGSVRWSVPPDHRGRITLSGDPAVVASVHTGETVEVIGLRPGLTELDVEVRDAAGATVESIKLPLSVPQFVSVTENAAAFEAVLDAFHLADAKDQLLEVAKGVCDLLLATANVRTVWTMAPFGETLPLAFAAGGVAAASVTTASFEGDPPSSALAGRTTAGASGGIGPNFFDETIRVFPGAFDDPVATGDASDVDDATRNAVAVIVADEFTSSPERERAIQLIGRLLGETLAHEIVHSLIGSALSGGAHNAPPVPSELMNRGNDRSLTARSAFEIVNPALPPDLDNLADRGIGFINIPHGDTQDLLNNDFPVPPHFR